MSRSFPSSRGSSTCPSYMVSGKMSDKNLEQRINIKFCVKIGKSANETLALLTVAYGEHAMKKSSVFEWHRREGVQDDPRSGQPKTQRTDANDDRVRSDRILGVKEEFNMNRETVRQIVKENLWMRNFPAKWCLESSHMSRNNVGFAFYLIFYAMQRCLIGSLPVFSIRPGNKTTEHAVENTELTSAEKSTLVSVAGQDHACVFLQSQGDSSLWIHCTRTNGKSTVLFWSADKVKGIS